MDKQQLFEPRLEEADVPLDGLGTVRVRALSRIEVFLMQKTDDEAEQDRRALHYGMVDPALTLAEAGKWQKSSPAGEIQPVVEKIRELSKLEEDSSKSGVPDVRGEPGDGVRALPGGEAEPDSRPAAPGDE